jgi:hypothetical protein
MRNTWPTIFLTIIVCASWKPMSGQEARPDMPLTCQRSAPLQFHCICPPDYAGHTIVQIDPPGEYCGYIQVYCNSNHSCGYATDVHCTAPGTCQNAARLAQRIRPFLKGEMLADMGKRIYIPGCSKGFTLLSDLEEPKEPNDATFIRALTDAIRF